MAHAYTPGLKVLENTSVEKERRLPLKGEVLVDKGADVTPEKIVAYKKAISMGIAAVVVGGFNYHDLKEVLGYTLGVAITGSEDIGTSLIITEGYGNIPMGTRSFDILKKHDGNLGRISYYDDVTCIPNRGENLFRVEKSTSQRKGTIQGGISSN